MNAAVVRDVTQPPVFTTFPDPVAAPDEVLVRVRYAAQSSLAKAQASGKHYAALATGEAFVPGLDGVGTLPDGGRVYFAFPRAPFGSMAEIVPVLRTNTFALPAAIDDAHAAAAGNPGMSSVAALVERARFARGESVLVNGATGVSGKLAVRVARSLGAKHVVVTGRNRATLDALVAAGADAAIVVDAPHDILVRSFRSALRTYRVNVILDYLWGAPAKALIEAIAGPGSAEGEPRVRFVQIGSTAGAEIALGAKTLRSAGMELLGSGLGSVSHARLIAATERFFEAYVANGFDIAIDVEPAERIEVLWNRPQRWDARLVFAF